ncbi:hypothetical protein [Actinomadura macra]|uniref:hypothetical protein n=1 Tax=Actinomadura macra TaxID=46164 RepID=UPI00082D87AB|nr:hypothetical protein [Actinomadura macra]
MYAWIWRHLPGTWQTKTAVALLLALAAGIVFWYLVFPWLEPKVQFDHGVVNGTPSSPPGPG